MSNENMRVAHIGQGKDTLTQIDKVPAHLDAVAKKCYKEVGNFLAKIDRLRETNLHNLEVFAAAYSQFVWACKEINDKNKAAMGDGYIQVFLKTGARQISPEITVRDGAADTMLKCSKLFGLDPKSEKELKGMTTDGQTSLHEYDEFYNAAK